MGVRWFAQRNNPTGTTARDTTSKSCADILLAGVDTPPPPANQKGNSAIF